MEHEEKAAPPPDEPIVIELDGELRHVRLSDAALAMVGLPTEAVLGRTPSEAGLPAEVVVPLERELRVALDIAQCTNNSRYHFLQTFTLTGSGFYKSIVLLTSLLFTL